VLPPATASSRSCCSRSAALKLDTVAFVLSCADSFLGAVGLCGGRASLLPEETDTGRSGVADRSDRAEDTSGEALRSKRAIRSETEPFFLRSGCPSPPWSLVVEKRMFALVPPAVDSATRDENLYQPSKRSK
jgi:hypothetical protein